MTFLSPPLLLFGLAVAVPLVLHLLQRHHGPRMMFPALRYLKRAEQEHATRIRLRQVLLLALRVLALLLLAAAAARPFLRGAGSGHEPTSVVLILDNSLSTGAVVDDRRVLDRLKEVARTSLADAGADDRFWLIRAGEPWEPAVTGEPGLVAAAVERTEPAGGAADLGSEIERAASILAAEPPERAREIHLLSDLQASGLTRLPARDATMPPITIVALDATPPANRAVTAVEVGGGLPPRAGERSTVTAQVIADTAAGGEPTTDSVSVRLVLDGAVRAVAEVAPGNVAVLPFPARSAGRVTGHVEIDPDALSGDDRRWFVAEVTAPPGVGAAESQPFLDEALGVLEDAGRIRRVGAGVADVVLAPGAVGAEAVRSGRAVVILPPSSPLELAATNQRLASAGIPWRLGPPPAGETRLQPDAGGLGDVLAGTRLRQTYRLEPQGTPDDSILARLRSDDPWAVRGTLPEGGRYVLLATPLTPEGGTIPTSAAMVPLLDRAVSVWAAAGAEPADHRPGDVVPMPSAGRVIGPDGGADEVREGSIYRLQGPGLYHLLAGADTVASYAVNPPASESDPARLSPDAVADRLPGPGVRVAEPDEWSGAIFGRRLGREISLLLVAFALAVLLAESALAAAGRGAAGGRPARDAGRSAARPTAGASGGGD